MTKMLLWTGKQNCFNPDRIRHPHPLCTEAPEPGTHGENPEGARDEGMEKERPALP